MGCQTWFWWQNYSKIYLQYFLNLLVGTSCTLILSLEFDSRWLRTNFSSMREPLGEPLLSELQLFSRLGSWGVPDFWEAFDDECRSWLFWNRRNTAKPHLKPTWKLRPPRYWDHIFTGRFASFTLYFNSVLRPSPLLTFNFLHSQRRSFYWRFTVLRNDLNDSVKHSTVQNIYYII